MISIPRRRPRIAAVRRSLLAVAVALAAAGVAARPPQPAAASAPLRIWYGSDDPTEQSWASQIVQSFKARYPSTQVQISFYSLDDMNQKTQLALSSGTGPDLIYNTPRGPGLPAYVRAGKLRDLSADAQRRGWAKQLRSGLLASYNSLLAANGPTRDAGHVYAVPYLMAADGILYNKDIFHKLGLSIPRTTAQFAALLPHLKRAGYTPIGFGNEDAWLGDAWYLTLLNAQLGPAALRPALRLSPSFTFAQAPFRQAAATLQGWAKAGYFSKNFGGLDPQESVQDFFEDGRTAMQLVSSTEYSQILQQSRADDAKVKNVVLFAFPGAHAGQPPVMVQDGYSGWAIPRAAHNPTAALDFIDNALSAHSAQTLVAHGLLPARRVDAGAARATFQRDALAALDTATVGVYLDAAPIPNFLATMEAQLQQLLAGKESPTTLTRTLQSVYASHGRTAQYTDTDGEF